MNRSWFLIHKQLSVIFLDVYAAVFEISLSTILIFRLSLLFPENKMAAKSNRLSSSLLISRKECHNIQANNDFAFLIHEKI